MQKEQYKFGQDTLPDLDGGVFEEKLSRAISDVARSVVLSDDAKRTGKVIVELTVSKIGESQVQVAHKLSQKKLTAKGDVTENNTTSTPLFVHTSGKLSVFQQKQEDMFKAQTQETI